MASGVWLTADLELRALPMATTPQLTAPSHLRRALTPTSSEKLWGPLTLSLFSADDDQEVDRRDYCRRPPRPSSSCLSCPTERAPHAAAFMGGGAELLPWVVGWG